MKKFLLLLIIPFLSFGQKYIPQSQISACICADMAIECINIIFENIEISKEEKIKNKNKCKKKLKPCDEKAKADSEFSKEVQKCIEEKLRKE